MRQEHPDDRVALTGEERVQFRQIWKDLADEPGGALGAEADTGAAWSPWSIAVIGCVIMVFVGLAANSVVLVVLASAGAVGARTALRRRSA